MTTIPGHNENVKIVFSLIGQQWIEEWNELNVDNIAELLVAEFNLRYLIFKGFYNTFLKDTDLLELVSANGEY